MNSARKALQSPMSLEAVVAVLRKECGCDDTCNGAIALVRADVPTSIPEHSKLLKTVRQLSASIVRKEHA